jgi:hypothetical protein
MEDQYSVRVFNRFEIMGDRDFGPILARFIDQTLNIGRGLASRALVASSSKNIFAFAQKETGHPNLLTLAARKTARAIAHRIIQAAQRSELLQPTRLDEGPEGAVHRIRLFGAIIQKIAESSRKTRGVLRQISKETSIVAIAILGNVLPTEGDFALGRLIETFNQIENRRFPDPLKPTNAVFSPLCKVKETSWRTGSLS